MFPLFDCYYEEWDPPDNDVICNYFIIIVSILL